MSKNKQSALRMSAARAMVQMMKAVPNAPALARMGMFDAAVALTEAAPAGFKPTEHWRNAPLGTSKNSPARDRRKALKTRAVKRAKALGHY